METETREGLTHDDRQTSDELGQSVNETFDELDDLRELLGDFLYVGVWDDAVADLDVSA